MATGIITPRQRCELRKQRLLKKKEDALLSERRFHSAEHKVNVELCFHMPELRHLIVRHLGYFDQIQFNKTSPLWYVELRCTDSAKMSVFVILNGLYHCYCMDVGNHFHNPITGEFFSGIGVGSEWNPSCYVIQEIDLKDIKNGDGDGYEAMRRKMSPST